MKDIVTYLRFQRERCVEEIRILDRFIIEIEAGDAEAMPTEFDPTWKNGARLTMAGRKALRTAWEHGMPQSEAARLFRISLTRAHVLHHEWRAEQAGTLMEAVDG